MAVVKANAYGHGAVPVARMALEAGASWLGVSAPDEALELRRAGIDAPILNLAFTPEAAYPELVRQRISLSVWNREMLLKVEAAAQREAQPARLHLKVDTGMGRLGAAPGQAMVLAKAAGKGPHLRLEGLYTHLADADNPDPAYTEQQLERFEQVRVAVTEHVQHELVVHAANSAALLRHPRARFGLVRPGILLYGAHPVPGWSDLALRPALTFRALVTRVQDVPAGSRIGYGLTWTAPAERTVATVAAGYADGVSRRLSNRGLVLLRGRRCPIVGRISMDQLMVDATDSGVRCGDAAVLLGGDGAAGLPVDEVAAAQGGIAWEVFCAISARVPRYYAVRGGQGEVRMKAYPRGANG
jgi:alanine racemase